MSEFSSLVDQLSYAVDHANGKTTITTADIQVLREVLRKQLLQVIGYVQPVSYNHKKPETRNQWQFQPNASIENDNPAMLWNSFEEMHAFFQTKPWYLWASFQGAHGFTVVRM